MSGFAGMVVAMQQPIISANIITGNLVLYYNPDDPASYSGSGTTINSLVSPKPNWYYDKYYLY